MGFCAPSSTGLRCVLLRLFLSKRAQPAWLFDHEIGSSAKLTVVCRLSKGEQDIAILNQDRSATERHAFSSVSPAPVVAAHRRQIYLVMELPMQFLFGLGSQYPT